MSESQLKKQPAFNPTIKSCLPATQIIVIGICNILKALNACVYVHTWADWEATEGWACTNSPLTSSFWFPSSSLSLDLYKQIASLMQPHTKASFTANSAQKYLISLKHKQTPASSWSSLLGGAEWLPHAVLCICCVSLIQIANSYTEKTHQINHSIRISLMH